MWLFCSVQNLVWGTLQEHFRTGEIICLCFMGILGFSHLRHWSTILNCYGSYKARGSHIMFIVLEAICVFPHILLSVRGAANWLNMFRALFVRGIPRRVCGSYACCATVDESRDQNVMHDLCMYFSQSFFKLAVTLFVTVPIAKCVFNLFSYWISNLSCLPAVQP